MTYYLMTRQERDHREKMPFSAHQILKNLSTLFLGVTEGAIIPIYKKRLFLEKGINVLKQPMCVCPGEWR